VGEDGPRPAGKRSRDPFAIEPDAPMTECEDPSVQEDKLAVPEATFDLTFGETKRNQLTPCNDAVLPLSQFAKHQSGPLPCNALRLRGRR
jgi:hypothetical protein